MSDAVEKIMEEYEKKRLKKEYERDKRITKIYSEFPEIEKIDKEINSSGARNVENIISNLGMADELNKEYSDKIKKLYALRNGIIEKNKIDPKFDSIKYDCEKCSDTGFTPDGKRCECFNRRLINYSYNRSNLSEILKRENFGTFSFDFYSKEKNGKRLSPYENMVEIYNSAKRFCKNFDKEEKGFVFYGSTGLGKTFLSSCIAKELMDSGKSVIYMSAPRLFILFEDYRFNRLDDESMVEDLYSADLLIIDDLGTENQNKNSVAALFDLMNERLSNDKKMIISTNYSMNELSRMYSSRFTSRIYEYFIIYGFYGDDIRIEKLKNR